MAKINYLKFILIIMSISLGIMYFYRWKFGETLTFTSQGRSKVSSFQRNGRSYALARFLSEGSGRFVIYTLSYQDENNQLIQTQFTTCGTFKLAADRILFVEPVDFHCTMLLTPIDELMGRSPVIEVRF
jgi:hypothetical protein